MEGVAVYGHFRSRLQEQLGLKVVNQSPFEHFNSFLSLISPNPPNTLYYELAAAGARLNSEDLSVSSRNPVTRHGCLASYSHVIRFVRYPTFKC